MDTYSVRFPGLFKDTLIEVNKVAFSIFGFPVYWYGIIIVFGALLGGLCTFRLGKKKEGLRSDDLLDYAIFIMIFSVIGARLYYVLTNLSRFDSFLDMIDIRGGGLAIYGGIIAGALTVFIVSKIKKINFFEIADAIVPGLFIGQIVGRWGNFFNQEAFGTNTSLPWGMISDQTKAYLARNQAALAERGIIVDPSMPVHPTFLYEGLWNLIGLVIVLLVYRKKKFNGQILYIYMAWYGFGRMLIEALRTDSLYVGPVRISQLVGALCFVAGAALLITQSLKASKKKSAAVLADGEGAEPMDPEKAAEASEETETSEAAEVSEATEATEVTEAAEITEETDHTTDPEIMEGSEPETTEDEDISAE